MALAEYGTQPLLWALSRSKDFVGLSFTEICSLPARQLWQAEELMYIGRRLEKEARRKALHDQARKNALQKIGVNNG
jgi:hypothetical protein